MVSFTCIYLHGLSITYHIKREGGQHTWVPGWQQLLTWLHACSDRRPLPVLCWLLSIGVCLPLDPPASIDRLLPLQSHAHGSDHSMVGYEDQSAQKQVAALYSLHIRSCSQSVAPE